MLDKLKTIYIGAELVTVFISIIWWEFIIAAAMLALAYRLILRSAARRKDYELLAFARELLNSCGKKGMHAALGEASRLPSAPKEFKEASGRSMLGETDVLGHCMSKDPEKNELMGIVAMGLQQCHDVRKNLKLFVSRLESDMENKNKHVQNSLNMDILSSFGVSFFVPLFGGICASIIGASGTISGLSTAMATKSFEIVVIVYVALMSYIMGLFKEEPGDNPLFRSFQATIIGAAIMRVASAFMIYAI